MKTITKEELNKILEDHKLWLDDNSKGARADLRNADLRYANFRDVDLSYVDLSYADLRYANLTNADLRYANLTNADLRNADLRNADLRYADLNHTNLRYADLSHTNLTNAYLYNANLTNAYLYNANLFNTIGNSKEIKTIQTSKYIINYTKDRIQIGCENHSYVEWFSMSDEDIEALDEGALDWWKEWKPIIQQIIKAS